MTGRDITESQIIGSRIREVLYQSERVEEYTIRFFACL